MIKVKNTTILTKKYTSKDWDEAKTWIGREVGNLRVGPRNILHSIGTDYRTITLDIRPIESLIRDGILDVPSEAETEERLLWAHLQASGWELVR